MIDYRPATESEWPAIIDLCVETIRHINIRDYQQEQVREWINRISNPGRMKNRLQDQSAWVAVDQGSLAGIITWTSGGTIDLLYVGKNHQRQGIGNRLISIAENKIFQQGVAEILVDVSITAKPLFEQNGYRVITPQLVDLGSVQLSNFKMTKRTGIAKDLNQ
ncbi:MAG TPA: GNAT family N-acetyltransferase [Saprospiraceae bacterium]|nr:GNAT family N-acetyltransferase [Saprospiraceae bacterium]HRV86596.1 GNAT family N-acetyltransferase [Saprospiraceae bacterium]